MAGQASHFAESLKPSGAQPHCQTGVSSGTSGSGTMISFRVDDLVLEATALHEFDIVGWLVSWLVGSC